MGGPRTRSEPIRAPGFDRLDSTLYTPRDLGGVQGSSPASGYGVLAQIFPKWTLKVPLYVALALPVGGAAVAGGIWYFFSPEYTDVGYRPAQPVPYSHALHVGELGLDCRYCHASVEESAVSNVPPTQVCMNCHHVAVRDSELLEPIRKSVEQNRPMRWVRIHNLPDYAFFDHSVHVGGRCGLPDLPRPGP